MAAAPTQDLPPRGGYSRIIFSRVPPRTYFNGFHLFAGFGAVTAVSCYLYFQTYKEVRQDSIEMRSGRLACEPLLLAERDREFLKQIRRNRDEEAKLMAGVEGWKVGMYKGEPIYKTLPKDKFVDPIVSDYFSHGHSNAYRDSALFSLYV